MNQNSPEDVSALLGDVNELVDNSHCHIDTSHIVSVSLRRAASRLAHCSSGKPCPLSN